MSEKPNIVLINCDDLGYGDLGCYGNTRNKTPFLDTLAREGMLFRSCYAPSPVCSPSRAGLMTGCYPARIGIPRVLFPGEHIGLSDAEYTLPQMLKKAGYRTMIVGKWHCGDQPPFLPCRHGFDEYYGLPYSNDMGMLRGDTDQVKYPPLPLLEGENVIQEQPDQRGLTERYVEQCTRFIRNNVDHPFFLYFAQMHVHLPLYSEERFVRESENGDYGACVAELDWACAAIVAELKRVGVYENTLIIFTSDNGSRAADGASNFPLRGNKHTTWEGGIRVPLIVHWKNRVPANTMNDSIICHVDFLPSLARLVGGSLSKNVIDGIDQLDCFFDPQVRIRDEMVYFGVNRDGADLNAYRLGEWKLHVRTGGEDVCQLFNLQSDIGETNDVAIKYPDKVAELQTRVEIWRERLGDCRAGRLGRECRAPGYVENARTLTVYDPNHPYIVAMYDKNDRG